MAKTDNNKKESTFITILRFLNINPNLVLLKISLFTMYGASASLLPYLTMHMQSIGLTVEEIAIAHLVLPFTTFLSAPITGYLVDKFGQYKPVAVMSLILNAIFHHSLLLIPLMETPGQVPPAYVLKHPKKDIVEVWWSPCPSRPCPDDQELDIILADCTDYCSHVAVEGTVVPPNEYTPPNPHTNKETTNEPSHESEEEIKELENGENDVDSKNLHFLLETDSKNKKKPPKSQKTQGCTKKNCKNEKRQPMVGMSAFMVLNMHPALAEPVENFGIEFEPDENEKVTDFKQRFDEELLQSNKVNITALEAEDLRCGGLMFTTNLTHNTLKELAADCILQRCHFKRGGPDICPPDYEESDDRIFWVYFFLRFISTIMLSGGVMMLDSIALTMIQKYGGEFGRERMFSTLGMAIFSPLTGMLIDQNTLITGYTNYSAAFYIYDILLGISAITIFLMPLGVKLPAEHVLRDVLKIIRLPHVLFFILFLFLLGNFWGFIESFLFLYLKELGASNYLLGVTISVGTLSSMPFLYGAGRITRKVGHINIIIIAFFSHAARLIGYSFIEDPWWCFPFEVIECVAVHLMWIAAATYCVILAPKSLLATLIGVLGMAHFSLGRGSGSFFGGFLISLVGIKESFRIMGILAIIAGISYGIPYYVWLRKFDYNKKQRKKNIDLCEGDHLNSEASENPNSRHKDSTFSTERLSLIIELNRKGSLMSLDKKVNIYNNKCENISQNAADQEYDNHDECPEETPQHEKEQTTNSGLKDCSDQTKILKSKPSCKNCQPESFESEMPISTTSIPGNEDVILSKSQNLETDQPLNK